MKLIVGLGNPGKKYRLTKHNIGFRVLEKIAKEHGIPLVEGAGYCSAVGRGELCGKKAALLLPQTFMNRSGDAVEAIFRKEIKDLRNMIVISDDINLALGRIRIRPRGSSGGHNGMSSIIQRLGTQDFARLRMGIATDIHRGDISGYVLRPFRRKDAKAVLAMIDRAADAVYEWLEKGIDSAMNTANN